MDSSEEQKQDSLVSLKWPVFVQGVGLSKVLKGETLESEGSRFKIKCYSAYMGKAGWKWADNVKIWISESAVAGRQYLPPRPTQVGFSFKVLVREES